MPRVYPHLESFRLNHRGVNRIATSRQINDALLRIADQMLAHARSISPEEHGDYKRSFRVRLHIRRDWPPSTVYRVPRSCADVVNVHPGALWIEKGSVRKETGKVVPGHYVLTRTLTKHRVVGESE